MDLCDVYLAIDVDMTSYSSRDQLGAEHDCPSIGLSTKSSITKANNQLS